MKLDILAFGSHPDDVELSCMGTLLKHLAAGHKAGIIDLTRGELGTRGTPETRDQEAADSARIAGLHARENLRFADGFFAHDNAHLLAVIGKIRKYQPAIVLANAVYDRHPDHGKGSRLVSEACFLAGLAKIETHHDGEPQKPWRPQHVYHYIQDRAMQPDFVVDISGFWEKKLDCIRAFRTQFFDPNSAEPSTYISSPEFMDFLEARAKEMGHTIGVTHGEGFVKERQLGVGLLTDLI